MSGEGMVGVAVVAVVGGSVWLAARGVQAGALVATRSVEMLGAGLAKAGDRAERNRAEWERGNAELLVWEAAARRVIDVNARIEVLRQHTPADLVGSVPVPLVPCAESPAELDTWCSTTRAKLDAIERDMRKRTSTAVLSVLRHTVDLERPVTAQEAFDRYHQALASNATPQRTTPPQAIVDVARILDRLTPDASDEDRGDVLAAAARVAVPRPDVDHETLLDELRLRVQRADERARARRANAVAAAMMLQAVPVGFADPELPGLRIELESVVAGQRALDAGLRARAEQAAARVRAQLERDYVRASVVDTLAGLGYEVDEGFATVTGNPDRMRLHREDWNGHAVQVVVNGDEVRAAVIRLEDKVGTDARREDVEREEQWCDDLEKLRTALVDSGMRVVERTLVPPGARVLPVAKSAERLTATREQVARERDL
jgi:hypothetical protein